MEPEHCPLTPILMYMHVQSHMLSYTYIQKERDEGGGQDKRGEGKLGRRVKCLVLCRNGLLRLTHTPGTREAAVSRSTPVSSFLLCLGHQIWAEQESWAKPGDLSPRPIPLGSLESRLQQRTSSHCFLSRVWSPLCSAYKQHFTVAGPRGLYSRVPHSVSAPLSSYSLSHLFMDCS